MVVSIKFTKQDIKTLSNTSGLTTAELSKLLMGKTNNEYVIVPKALVQDINGQLIDNIMYINEINTFMYNNWQKLIKTNQDVTYKWEKALKILY